MNIAVTGSTGLVGSAFCRFLSESGHQAVPLRRPAQWDVEKGTVDAAALSGVEAVVHLAGENIAAGRWTRAKKARIRMEPERNTLELTVKSGGRIETWHDDEARVIDQLD